LVFPEAEIKGCAFHWCQAVMRKVDSGEVEDEIHFLLSCSKFREERPQLFKTISQSCNNFLQLNPRAFGVSSLYMLTKPVYKELTIHKDNNKITEHRALPKGKAELVNHQTN
jgi:hypothetical protein